MTSVISLLPLIGTRAANALVRGGIEDVESVRAASDEELLAIPSFGRLCLAAVRRATEPEYDTQQADALRAEQQRKRVEWRVEQARRREVSELYAARIDAMKCLARRHREEFAVLFEEAKRNRGLLPTD